MKEVIQAFKETKERLEAERNKLKKLEVKFQGLITQVSKLDNAITGVLQEKENVLKRFALGETSQDSIDRIKKKYEGVILEKGNAQELITVTEKLMQQCKEEITLLDSGLTGATGNIWSEIIGKLTRDMESALGDRPKLIWAAMSGVTKPGYLPFLQLW